MVLLFAEVHPFGSVTAEPITVDLVSPDEAEKAPKEPEPVPEPKAQPSDTVELSSKSEASSSPAPSAAAATATPPGQQSALPTPRFGDQQATVQPQSPS